MLTTIVLFLLLLLVIYFYVSDTIHHLAYSINLTLRMVLIVLVIFLVLGALIYII